LTGSPFRIVRETGPWQRLRDSGGRPLPLRAGVSSFGFGGVNAHVLLEEPPARDALAVEEDGTDRVFVVSAKTEQALDRAIRQLLTQLDSWDQDPSTCPAADDVAFTLRAGREEMTERLAVVASSLADLRRLLAQVLEGDQGSPRVYRGRAESQPSGSVKAPSSLVSGGADRLAQSWATGAAVEWADVQGDVPRRRISLPGYPFDRKRYWFSAPDGVQSRPAFLAPQAREETAAADVTAAGERLSGEEYIRAGLRDILLEKLKLADDELDENRNLADFGVDSMLSAMIMQVVQDEFDVQVPLTALVEHPTLRSLSAYIHREFFADRELTGTRRRGAGPGDGARGSASGEQRRFPPELVPINMDGTRQPSFWVHGAAGYSAWFQNLSQALGPDYPVYAFQARGTDGHSMPQTLEEMVEHYVDCLRLVQPKGPYIMGGYSFGGLVAMRMAQRLQEQGETIRHLIMFDTYPATQEVFDRHQGMYDHDFLQLYLTNYFLKLDEHPERAIRQEDVAHLPSSLRVAELARLAKERGGRRISTDDIYLYLRGGLVCSGHAEGIYQLFEMKPYDASDVLFFKATDGFTGRASEIYWQPTKILDGYDYETPWREVVKGEFRVVELERAGHLRPDEEGKLAATNGFGAVAFSGDADEIDEHAGQLAQQHPAIADYLPLLTTCQSALMDVMTGRREATDVIFPGGSMELVAEIYKGSIQSEFYNRLVADQVAEHIRHFVRRYPYARAQIFEVGSGTGGTSTFVLDALGDRTDQLRYFFTDVGAAFLRVAEAQFGPQHPFVDFAAYDVERPPAGQGFEPRSMDVVVASNVLHTTRHIDAVLRNCRDLLKPDGILIINELTHRMDCNTLTFGLTTGWWLYEDEDKRIPGSPLIDTAHWRETLSAAGFGEVEIHGVPGAGESEQVQCVIVAKALTPSVPEQGETVR
jgi:pimeloyl-ACP methyl ester carboxylesterase/acyl carrier protein/SAM-dependent methyltransferase